MANEVDLLDVGWVVVVDELGREVVVSGLLWVELEADDTEALALDEAPSWVGFESVGWVLKDLIVNWGVTGVRNLKSLID